MATSSTQDQATQVKDHANERARRVKGQAPSEAQSVAAKSGQQVSVMFDEARSELRQQAETRTDQWSSRLAPGPRSGRAGWRRSGGLSGSVT